jgi:transposase
MAKRKQYTEEFKREAVRLLVTRGERSAAEVAKGLGVAGSVLYQWRKAFTDIEVTAVNGRGESKEEELSRLRREVSVLRKEREVLKKSIMFFVRETDR